jgi:hypothetical protein
MFNPNVDMTTEALVFLAISLGMIRSERDFMERSEQARCVILRQVWRYLDKQPKGH